MPAGKSRAVVAKAVEQMMPFYRCSCQREDTAAVCTLQSLNTTAGHGKLLVDDSLYPYGYGTNVNEQYISEFNLATANRTASYNYSSFTGSSCTGTHSLVYSNYSDQ